jgi:hypothetical protein
MNWLVVVQTTTFVNSSPIERVKLRMESAGPALLTLLSSDMVRESIEFLDIGDLALASAAAAEMRLAARPLFFKALRREFPRIAAEEEQAIDSDPDGGGERVRRLELAARRRIGRARKLCRCADALEAAPPAGDNCDRSLMLLPPEPP